MTRWDMRAFCSPGTSQLMTSPALIEAGSGVFSHHNGADRVGGRHRSALDHGVLVAESRPDEDHDGDEAKTDHCREGKGPGGEGDG